MIEFGYIACLLAGVCFGIAGTLFYQIWIDTADDWGDSPCRIEFESAGDDMSAFDDLPYWLLPDNEYHESLGRRHTD